jgi:hypothetical protein
MGAIQIMAQITQMTESKIIQLNHVDAVLPPLVTTKSVMKRRNTFDRDTENRSHAHKALHDHSPFFQHGTSIVVVSMAVRTEHHIRISPWFRNTQPLKGVKNDTSLSSPQLETRMSMPHHFDHFHSPSFQIRYKGLLYFKDSHGIYSLNHSSCESFIHDTASCILQGQEVKVLIVVR